MKQRTIGWYEDRGGSGVYTWWNGVCWSARAFYRWSAEDAARQASVPSSHEPKDPIPVGVHAFASTEEPAAHVLEMLLAHVQGMESRIAACECGDLQARVVALERQVNALQAGARRALDEHNSDDYQ